MKENIKKKKLRNPVFFYLEGSGLKISSKITTNYVVNGDIESLTFLAGGGVDAVKLIIVIKCYVKSVEYIFAYRE